MPSDVVVRFPVPNRSPTNPSWSKRIMTRVVVVAVFSSRKVKHAKWVCPAAVPTLWTLRRLPLARSYGWPRENGCMCVQVLPNKQLIGFIEVLLCVRVCLVVSVCVFVWMTTKKRKLKPGLRRNKKNNNNKWQRSREKGFSAGSQCFGWANVLHRQAGVNMAAELIFRFHFSWCHCLFWGSIGVYCRNVVYLD